MGGRPTGLLCSGQWEGDPQAYCVVVSGRETRRLIVEWSVGGSPTGLLCSGQWEGDPQAYCVAVSGRETRRLIV